ncbi:hypothetical protein [Anaerotignum sp.]|uniref:hypothetical protein n=1 Tax=Anaerotignum sp. TaxID=2039241 RepID=UPI0028AFB28A|nr:hypothetical protein [Anaerotignum sp.]
MIEDRRLHAALLTILIFFTLFFSTFFVALKSNHECIGKSCPICHDIQSCVDATRSLTFAIVASTVFVGSSYCIVRITTPIFISFTFHTLVSLKVKLTN